ncbi:putative GAF-like domain superfamily protein [Plasmopara halstedii]
MPADVLENCIGSTTLSSVKAVEFKSSLQIASLHVISDDESPASPTYNESPSSQKLLELLTQGASDESNQETLRQRRAAMDVLGQLLLIAPNKTSEVADISTQLEDSRMVEALKDALDVSQYPKELDACDFASDVNSATPVLAPTKSKESEPEPTMYPIPANEEIRMNAIHHYSLHDILNVPELNLICSLAAAEMNCPHGIVTLVERDVVSILAANNHEYWEVGSGNPREQTFCQQFIMHEKPLLVHHAETDPRFERIAPVTKLNLQFYAGFPLTISSVSNNSGQASKVIIGALCCLDEKPRNMTRSQYWRLVKLAKAASNILEKTAKEYVTKSRPISKELEISNFLALTLRSFFHTQNLSVLMPYAFALERICLTTIKANVYLMLEDIYYAIDDAFLALSGKRMSLKSKQVFHYVFTLLLCSPCVHIGYIMSVFSSVIRAYAPDSVSITKKTS